jgi:protein TonB
VEVNENGSVSNVIIIKSSGFKLLDDAALETVKKWLFIPATKNSKPVPGTIKIPINFKLI